MSETRLAINTEVDQGLLMNARELVGLFLTDIPLIGLGGQRVPDETIENKVRTVTDMVEGDFSIKIPPQIRTEEHDFVASYYRNWGFVKLNYYISDIIEFGGFINQEKVVNYPPSWVDIKRAGDPHEHTRNIHIIPSSRTISGEIGFQQSLQIFADIAFVIRLNGAAILPNAWHITYCTGFQQTPYDLADIIGKLAAIQVLNILGDITFGAGIASKSISIDGLSQSLGTTQSAENSLYSARQRTYEKELFNKDFGSYQKARSKYGGNPIMTVV